MKITNKHKAYAGIVGLALLAFGLDRGFGGANAAQATPVAEIAGNHVAAVVITKGAVASATSLTARLHVVATGQATDNQNAFAPSKTWVITNKATAVATVNGAEDFKKTHVLSAVIQSSHGGQAMIGGKLIRVGETVDGYKLTSIARDGVRLAGAGGQVELRTGIQR